MSTSVSMCKWPHIPLSSSSLRAWIDHHESKHSPLLQRLLKSMIVIPAFRSLVNQTFQKGANPKWMSILLQDSTPLISVSNSQAIQSSSIQSFIAETDEPNSSSASTATTSGSIDFSYTLLALFLGVGLDFHNSSSDSQSNSQNNLFREFLDCCEAQTIELPSDSNFPTNDSLSSHHITEKAKEQNDYGTLNRVTVLPIHSLVWMDIMAQLTLQFINHSHSQLYRQFGTIPWSKRLEHYDLPILLPASVSGSTSSSVSSSSSSSSPSSLSSSVLSSLSVSSGNVNTTKDAPQFQKEQERPLTNNQEEKQITEKQDWLNLVLDNRVIQYTIAATIQTTQNLIASLPSEIFNTTRTTTTKKTPSICLQLQQLNLNQIPSWFPEIRHPSQSADFILSPQCTISPSFNSHMHRLKYSLGLLKQLSILLVNYMLTHNGHLPESLQLPSLSSHSSSTSDKKEDHDKTNTWRIGIGRGGGGVTQFMIHSWNFLEKSILNKFDIHQKQEAIRVWSFVMIECYRIILLIEFRLWYFHIIFPTLFQLPLYLPCSSIINIPTSTSTTSTIPETTSQNIRTDLFRLPEIYSEILDALQKPIAPLFDYISAVVSGYTPVYPTVASKLPWGRNFPLSHSHLDLAVYYNAHHLSSSLPEAKTVTNNFQKTRQLYLFTRASCTLLAPNLEIVRGFNLTSTDVSEYTRSVSLCSSDASETMTNHLLSELSPKIILSILIRLCSSPAIGWKLANYTMYALHEWKSLAPQINMIVDLQSLAFLLYGTLSIDASLLELSHVPVINMKPAHISPLWKLYALSESEIKEWEHKHESQQSLNVSVGKYNSEFEKRIHLHKGSLQPFWFVQYKQQQCYDRKFASTKKSICHTEITRHHLASFGEHQYFVKHVEAFTERRQQMLWVLQHIFVDTAKRFLVSTNKAPAQIISSFSSSDSPSSDSSPASVPPMHLKKPKKDKLPITSVINISDDSPTSENIGVVNIEDENEDQKKDKKKKKKEKVKMSEMIQMDDSTQQLYNTANDIIVQENRTHRQLTKQQYPQFKASTTILKEIDDHKQPQNETKEQRMGKENENSMAKLAIRWSRKLNRKSEWITPHCLGGNYSLVQDPLNSSLLFEAYPGCILPPTYLRADSLLKYVVRSELYVPDKSVAPTISEYLQYVVSSAATELKQSDLQKTKNVVTNSDSETKKTVKFSIQELLTAFTSVPWNVLHQHQLVYGTNLADTIQSWNLRLYMNINLSDHVTPQQIACSLQIMTLYLHDPNIINRYMYEFAKDMLHHILSFNYDSLQKATRGPMRISMNGTDEPHVLSRSSMILHWILNTHNLPDLPNIKISPELLVGYQPMSHSKRNLMNGLTKHSSSSTPNISETKKTTNSSSSLLMVSDDEVEDDNHEKKVETPRIASTNKHSESSTNTQDQNIVNSVIEYTALDRCARQGQIYTVYSKFYDSNQKFWPKSKDWFGPGKPLDDSSYETHDTKLPMGVGQNPTLPTARYSFFDIIDLAVDGDILACIETMDLLMICISFQLYRMMYPKSLKEEWIAWAEDYKAYLLESSKLNSKIDSSTTDIQHDSDSKASSLSPIDFTPLSTMNLPKTSSQQDLESKDLMAEDLMPKDFKAEDGSRTKDPPQLQSNMASWMDDDSEDLEYVENTNSDDNNNKEGIQGGLAEQTLIARQQLELQVKKQAAILAKQTIALQKSLEQAQQKQKSENAKTTNTIPAMDKIEELKRKAKLYGLEDDNFAFQYPRMAPKITLFQLFRLMLTNDDASKLWQQYHQVLYINGIRSKPFGLIDLFDDSAATMRKLKQLKEIKVEIPTKSTSIPVTTKKKKKRWNDVDESIISVTNSTLDSTCPTTTNNSSSSSASSSTNLKEESSQTDKKSVDQTEKPEKHEKSEKSEKHEKPETIASVSKACLKRWLIDFGGTSKSNPHLKQRFLDWLQRFFNFVMVLPVDDRYLFGTDEMLSVLYDSSTKTFTPLSAQANDVPTSSNMHRISVSKQIELLKEWKVPIQSFDDPRLAINSAVKSKLLWQIMVLQHVIRSIPNSKKSCVLAPFEPEITDIYPERKGRNFQFARFCAGPKVVSIEDMNPNLMESLIRKISQNIRCKTILRVAQAQYGADLVRDKVKSLASAADPSDTKYSNESQIMSVANYLSTLGFDGKKLLTSFIQCKESHSLATDYLDFKFSTSTPPAQSSSSGVSSEKEKEDGHEKEEGHENTREKRQKTSVHNSFSIITTTIPPKIADADEFTAQESLSSTSSVMNSRDNSKKRKRS
jgi:hypothetical protein